MPVLRQRFKDLANRFVNKTFADFTETYVIQQPSYSSDGQGGRTKTWSTFATITGFVMPEDGQETMNDDRLKSSYRKKFMFEYVAGITNNMRISFNSKIYNIRSIVTSAEQDIWIEIIGDEEVAT